MLIKTIFVLFEYKVFIYEDTKMNEIYILDDNFRISEEIENLSEAELDRRIAILEQEAIDEGKNIPHPKLPAF